MEFKSILFADTGQETEKTEPAFFRDLHLDYILNIIKHLAGDYQINQYYYTFPVPFPLVKYRQQVFRDLMDKDLCHAIYNFCSGMQKSRHSYMLSLECKEPVQTAGYHLEAALAYWESLEIFGQSLEKFNPVSDGINSLKTYVLKHISECQESGFSSAAAGAREIFSQMRFHMAINQGNITITVKDNEENDVERDYLMELAELLQAGSKTHKTSLSGIFPNALEPSYLETSLIKLLKRNNPGIFNEIQSFYKNYPDFYSKELLRFEEEIQFYLGFLNFKEKTEAHGYSLNIPQFPDENKFSGNGIYDIALVWKSVNRDYKVVSNDFCLGSIPSFFVVTGSNQGGKTTFARSVGQAVYFSMMGLFANALSLELPLFKGILAHFEAEEKIQSNSGKLKEEIDRLVPMMKNDKRQHFVILNELFTTATTNDALIMGKKVMEHFLEKDCYGIYVTHIQELAEETDRITSLVAQIADSSDGDKKRTYRMVHMEAQGYGYSDSLVKKFQLSYEDIMRRIT